ncbi:unnamed protein product [Diatraea saccharalis]|nr:unnamed protein product [Diatraea saccharalis]
MDTASTNLAALLHKLCVSLSPDPDGAYELAVSYLSSTSEKSRTNLDERLLCQKIQSRLTTMSTRDVDKFNECYTKLKSSFVLKQRVSIMALLLALSETPQQSESTQQLFPIPQLASISSIGFPGGASSSSKSTIGSVSWDSQGAPKNAGSNQSLSSNKTNMALMIPAKVNDNKCVRDAVLAATGVKTKGICTASRPMQMMYSRIAHLGFLHDRLKEFIDPNSGLMPQGLMGEGLVASIRDELTEYYRSVALLQSQ